MMVSLALHAPADYPFVRAFFADPDIKARLGSPPDAKLREFCARDEAACARLSTWMYTVNVNIASAAAAVGCGMVRWRADLPCGPAFELVFGVLPAHRRRGIGVAVERQLVALARHQQQRGAMMGTIAAVVDKDNAACANSNG